MKPVYPIFAFHIILFASFASFAQQSTANTTLQKNLANNKAVVDAFNLPVDKNATKETVNLYNNLKRLLKKGIMFGHQDDLASCLL